MGSLHVTLCAIAALGTVAVTPAAYAADRADGGVSVSPSAPHPGGDIALLVSGCREKTALAVSTAFVADARLTVGADGTLVGQSRIRSTLTAGTYDVKVACGDASRAGAVNVVRRGNQPAAHASPVAPVDAGAGGTAHLAVVDARAAGPGTAHTVTGLVLAGVAATAVALRSARRSREQRGPH
ncbi:membrane protein [Streptomyces viridochromogenes]|uniref:Membrane protein n=1 Tax=Streptomyces viridochromogenes TaxID=1938 RepID=A0A0J7ZB46_STRVR|nr:membrane protein [Streptomyces viridochromogenes]KMS72398.1 membrane protein [Streptomyces viridochromogenes]KOG07000.1 membrane protein [Streptomyces viridochromogenes]KOG08312.1 membrane protein [Streptomyces viridochromogenes]